MLIVSRFTAETIGSSYFRGLSSKRSVLGLALVPMVLNYLRCENFQHLFEKKVQVKIYFVAFKPKNDKYS